MKKCPYCAEEIQESAKKCKHCGEWLIDNNKGLGRLGFNILLFILFIISIFINLGSYVPAGTVGPGGVIFTIGLIILSIFRFQNLGRSGWYSLGMLVPIYSFYLLILLIFYKKDPTKKENIKNKKGNIIKNNTKEIKKIKSITIIISIIIILSGITFYYNKNVLDDEYNNELFYLFTNHDSFNIKETNSSKYKKIYTYEIKYKLVRASCVYAKSKHISNTEAYNYVKKLDYSKISKLSRYGDPGIKCFFFNFLSDIVPFSNSIENKFNEDRIDYLSNIKQIKNKSFRKIFKGDYFKNIKKNIVYYRKKDNIGNNWIIVKGADASTFKQYEESEYFLDKYNIYYHGKKLENSNSKTFEIVNLGDYYKDKNNVYCNGEIIEGADSKTFEHIGDVFGGKYVDKKYEYGSCF